MKSTGKPGRRFFIGRIKDFPGTRQKPFGNRICKASARTCREYTETHKRRNAVNGEMRTKRAAVEGTEGKRVVTPIDAL